MKVKLAIGESDTIPTSIGVTIRGVNLVASRLPFIGVEGRLAAMRATYCLLTILKESPDAVVDEADLETLRGLIARQEQKQ